MPDDLEQDDFVEALDAGDAKSAADILRQLKSLDGEALQALANMLDGGPEIRHFHPYKLVLQRWSRGKPTSRVENRVRSTTRAMMIAQAKKTFLKLEAALTHVKEKTGAGRSTLLGDWGRLTKGRKAKKSGKKPN